MSKFSKKKKSWVLLTLMDTSTHMNTWSRPPLPSKMRSGNKLFQTANQVAFQVLQGCSSRKWTQLFHLLEMKCQSNRQENLELNISIRWVLWVRSTLIQVETILSQVYWKELITVLSDYHRRFNHLHLNQWLQDLVLNYWETEFIQPILLLYIV